MKNTIINYGSSMYVTNKKNGLIEIEFNQALDFIKGYTIEGLISQKNFKIHIDYLRSEKDHDKRQDYKGKNMPFFTFNGVFYQRTKKGLKKSSGLMVLDYDETLAGEETNKIRNKLINDKYVCCVFTSPSGALKYLIKIPLVKDDDEFKEYYRAVVNYYNKLNIILDQSGKNVDRLCFLSSDKDIYVNLEKETFTTKIKEPIQEKVKNQSKKETKTSNINQKVPKYCSLIETFLIKNNVQSRNGQTKHTQIDPNVYNYAISNNKQIVIEDYKEIQNRTDGAFNNADKVPFNCGAMINFIKKAGYESEFSKCEKCGEYKKHIDNTEEVEKIEIKEDITREEVRDILEVLSKCKDDLLVEDKVKELSKNTNYTLYQLHQLIKKIGKDKKKEEKEEEGEKETHYFEDNNYGIFYYKMQWNNKKGEFERIDIASFKELKKETKEVTNLFSHKIQIVNNNILSIPLFKPNIISEAINELETSNLLETSKHCKVYTLKSDDIRIFINKFNNNKSIAKTESKHVNIYAFQNKKYYEPKDYKCYNYSQRIINGERQDKLTKGFVAENFEEFLEINPEKEIINQCIIDLNSLPINLDDGQIWKGILCKSIAMMLKMELVNLGCNFFPIDVIMGEKETGKTTLNKLLVRCLWNSSVRDNSEMSGSVGARLDYPNDIRPLVYEELKGFKPNWIDILKEGMTRGVFTIKKGTPDQGMNIKYIFQNYFVDTNEFNVDDDAFKQRMCFWEKNTKITGLNNLDIINNLELNIKHLGKSIYNNFINLDLPEIWKEAQDYILKLDITKSTRKRIKLSQIRFGEIIIEKIHPELFNLYMLDYDNLFKNKSYFLFDNADNVSDIIKRILSKISIKCDNSKETTITQIINNIVIGDEYLTTILLDRYGLIVSKGGHLCMTKGFLPLINSEINTIKKFTSLKEIQTILKLECKIINYIYKGNDTTKTGISIITLLEK